MLCPENPKNSQLICMIMGWCVRYRMVSVDFVFQIIIVLSIYVYGGYLDPDAAKVRLW